MTTRFHVSKRLFHLALVVLATYVLGSFLILSLISAPSTKQGLLELQNGQHYLITNPELSANSFAKASDAFEESASRLQQAPYLLKITSVLPPFRWQVRLIKANHSLALAGRDAALLVRSFPTLANPETPDLTSLLSESSKKYLEWHSSRSAMIQEVETNLADANQEFQNIPDWIAFGDRKQLLALKHSVSQAHSFVSEANQLTNKLRPALGSSDDTSHAWILVFGNPSSTPPPPYALIEAQKGTITNYTYGATPLPPVQPASFEQMAASLAQVFPGQSTKKIEGVISVDPKIFSNLLAVSGPLPLSGNPLALASSATPGSQLAKTPVLTELLPLLTSRLSQNTENMETVGPIFKKGFEQKLIQVWSSSPELQELFSALTK